MSKRKLPLRIVAALLGAFSAGIWLGAEWHASVHHLEDVAEIGTRIFAHPCSQQTGRIELSDDHDCPICQVGTSAPQLCAPLSLLLPPLQQVGARPAWTRTDHAFRGVPGLPLQRGPPVRA